MTTALIDQPTAVREEDRLDLEAIVAWLHTTLPERTELHAPWPLEAAKPYQRGNSGRFERARAARAGGHWNKETTPQSNSLPATRVNSIDPELEFLPSWLGELRPLPGRLLFVASCSVTRRVALARPEKW